MLVPASVVEYVVHASLESCKLQDSCGAVSEVSVLSWLIFEFKADATRSLLESLADLAFGDK